MAKQPTKQLPEKPVVPQNYVYKFELEQWEANLIVEALLELQAKLSWNTLKKMEAAMIAQSTPEQIKAFTDGHTR
jgi:hypothetical protein